MRPKQLSYYGKRLVARLKADHDIDLPSDVEIHRTYAGHWQRSKEAQSQILNSLGDSGEKESQLGRLNRGFKREIGRIDDEAIVESVTRVMEGGREAFRQRADFYKKHPQSDS